MLNVGVGVLNTFQIRQTGKRSTSVDGGIIPFASNKRFLNILDHNSIWTVGHVSSILEAV